MPDSEAFDFIIVGAGSAGCVLADRLTASGRHRVLLLEAGPGNLHPWLHIPLGFGKLFSDRRYNWCYATMPQPECHNRNVIAPRGKVLGGSSSINGLIYIRGQAEDFDYWRQLGNAGWSFDDVLPYFRKAENNERGADEFHGAGGPLGVSDLRDRHPLAVAYVEAAVQCGYPRNDDFNGAGAGRRGLLPDHDEQRRALLGRARLSQSGAAARQSQGGFQGARHPHCLRWPARHRCRVSCRQRQTQRARQCRGDRRFGRVQFAATAAAFGARPGVAAAIARHPVIADAPGVGDDLNDHISGRIILRCKDPITLNDAVRNLSGKLTHGLHYVLTRRGYLAIPAVSSAVFHCARFPHRQRPTRNARFRCSRPAPSVANCIRSRA